MPLITLTPSECRALGVLVEKAQTVPGQYPLTLNSLTTGCNQKNNREPILELTEEEAGDAIEGLITKGLARQVQLAGSRVNKYRHVARESLGVTTAELVILAELLLRGPQSVGELRGRASRMMPQGDDALSTLESAQAVLDGLMQREEPMVRRLPRRPGERAERWMQLLCPDLHPLDGPVAHAAAEGGSATVGSSRDAQASDLRERVERLEHEVERLRTLVERLTG